MNAELIAKADEILAKTRDSADIRLGDWRYVMLDLRNALSALESESSPHVVAEPVALKQRVSEIEDAIACNKMSAAEVFTQMRTAYQAYAPQQTAPVTEAKSLSVPMMRRLVCSANKYGEIVVLGIRHGDPNMGNILRALDKAGVKVDRENEVQGFIDNRSQFVDRVEGLAIARAAGQIVKKHGRETELYSEDFIPGYIPSPPLNTQDGVDADDYKTRLAILDENWLALKVASAICDAVPTKAQEVEGPLKFIGELVNVRDNNGVNGYTLIRNAYNVTDKYLKTVPPDSIEETAKASAQFIEILERAKTAVDARSNLSKNTITRSSP